MPTRSFKPLVCLLPNHFVRILVFPNAEKHRLPQPIIPGPFREFDLANHRRFYPTATLHLAAVNPCKSDYPHALQALWKALDRAEDLIQN
jgi:hypothetical protein